MRLTLNEAPPRLSIAMLLAVPLVYALFVGASWLIKVDDLVMIAAPERVLTKITPTEETLVVMSDDRKPKPLELADQPPLPVRDKVTTAGAVPGYTYAPPEAEFELIGFKAPVVAVTVLAGRNIQVVRAPAPSVPAMATTRGISGSCDVLFDVDTRGRPFNLTAQCTDDVFRAEAIRAVSKAEFLPRVSQTGVAVEQHGAVYPIVFEVK
jgi:protein TonB